MCNRGLHGHGPVNERGFFQWAGPSWQIKKKKNRRLIILRVNSGRQNIDEYFKSVKKRLMMNFI